MNNPYEMFSTDKDLETGSGVTLDYPGFSITIHRAGGANKKFSSVFAAKLKPHRRKYEQGVLDDEIANRILVEAYAETVVTGWKDVRDKNNKKMAFSIENCVKLFTDLPELFRDIQDQANAFSTFKAEIEAVEEKN